LAKKIPGKKYRRLKISRRLLAMGDTPKYVYISPLTCKVVDPMKTANLMQFRPHDSAKKKLNNRASKNS